ncbi:MAG: tetratricopeptide repeat protein, partial [Thermoguttaceae bacterium]
RQAMEIAIPLREHPNPTVRNTARDVLINAQLSIIKDIACGNWENKWGAIEKWVSSVKEVIMDPEIAAKKVLVREYLFRLATTGLSAQATISDSGDLEPYIQDVLLSSEELFNVINDPIYKRRVQWEAGCAIFDAVQTYQRKKMYTAALKYGEEAVDFIEQGIEGRTEKMDYFLLSRLYFRLGAIHAIGMKNHRAAIIWFDRTMPIFDDIQRDLGPEEVGRIGEMLVSMGVSYWETDQREEAVRLSELGLKRIRAAVDKKYLEASALLIPYSNLSTMYTKLDEVDKAAKYQQQAVKIREALLDSGATRRQ